MVKEIIKAADMAVINARFELFENDFNHKFELVNIRLKNAEESDARIENRLSNIEQNQQRSTAALLDLSQKQEANGKKIEEIHAFLIKNEDNLKRLANNYTWRDKFKEQGYGVLGNWFWKLMILALLAGIGYVAGHNRLDIKDIKTEIAK